MKDFFLPVIESTLLRRLGSPPLLRVEGALTSQDMAQAASLLGGGEIAIVADSITWQALGKRVATAIPAETRHVIFPTMPAAEADAVLWLSAQSSECDGILAVGSGTISDLCKLVAANAHKPYAVFPTAPSMNGYLSANASIAVNGKKQSFPAVLPRGVFCDMGVLCAAPARLIQSGLGDSLARSTAQADWLLAHLLRGTAYDETPFALLAHYEAALFLHAPGLRTGDYHAILLLLKTILLSGLGMTLAGGSHPASQGEHMIAHAMHMLYGASLPHAYHGEEIGVTTLTMARLQEKCLDSNNVTGDWPRIRDCIRSITVPSHVIESTLLAAGCPTKPEDLGWSAEQYRKAIAAAPATRDRFTFLSL